MKFHPIIVLEGPDACGKTTWARTFLRETRARYIHLPLRRHMYDHQVMSLTLAAKWSLETPVLIDRHWPSEQIYAGVYRGGSLIQYEAAILDRVMTLIGVTYVVCLLGSIDKMVDAHRKSIEKRHEMYENDDRYRRLVTGYIDWWEGTDTSGADIGYCAKTSGMKMRPLSSHLYNYLEHGTTEMDLAMHVADVCDLAYDLREFSASDSRGLELSSNPRSIVNQCIK